MTAAALLGFGLARHAAFLFLLAIPLGLGAGSVDAALNNFVALHYKSMHMNWLHCFWGVGATAGLMIMSFFLASGRGWRQAMESLPLFSLCWSQRCGPAGACGGVKMSPLRARGSSGGALSNREALRLPNVKLALVSFVCFSITEWTTGLWSSTYLVGVEGMAPAVAARWTAAFTEGLPWGACSRAF